MTAVCGLGSGQRNVKRSLCWHLGPEPPLTALQMVPCRALVSFVSRWLWWYSGVIRSISGRSAAVRENNE